MNQPFQAEVKALTSGWWLLLAVGLLSIAAGVIILFKPSDSLATLAVIVGIFILIDGIIELVDSLFGETRNRGMVALFGVITAIVGVLLIRHPVGGVTFVALLIALWLIAVGVIRFATAFDEPEHRGWYALLGLVEMVAGIVIVANPDIGYATLAVLVGIGFILNGIATAILGWGMHEVRKGSAGARPMAPAT
ncbi:MAG TPA: HdeD family acid-resistance protein [Solirubrobacterales bacterium]|nr:HdeD family acid-resistance protein [Solirubrobacterales bacterium]